MIISLIAAVSKNNVIGRDGKLPWNLPEDLQHFKKTTEGKPVILGRGTYEAVGRILPYRENIIISRTMPERDDAKIVRSIEEALDYSRKQNYEKVYVIGGQTIYKEFMPMADELIISHVHQTIPDGDRFFPKIDENKWKETKREDHDGFHIAWYSRI